MAESTNPLSAGQVIADLSRRYELIVSMEPDLQFFREIHGYIKTVTQIHGLEGHFLYEEFTKWQEVKARIERDRSLDREAMLDTLREFYFWPVYDELWQVYGALETLLRKIEDNSRPETGTRFAMLLTEFALDDRPMPDNHFLLRKDRYKNWIRFVHPILTDACKTWLDDPKAITRFHLSLDTDTGILVIGPHAISLNLRQEKTQAFYLMERMISNPRERYYYSGRLGLEH